jgi:hypothetical protein
MKGGVPATSRLLPKGTSVPKSINFTRPSGVSQTLRALTSRCRKRRACSSASAEAVSRKILQTSTNGRGARLDRSLPSSSSIV